MREPYQHQQPGYLTSKCSRCKATTAESRRLHLKRRSSLQRVPTGITEVPHQRQRRQTFAARLSSPLRSDRRFSPVPVTSRAKRYNCGSAAVKQVLTQTPSGEATLGSQGTMPNFKEIRSNFIITLGCNQNPLLYTQI